MKRYVVSELTLTQADKGKSITVQQGDVVLIRLPENPTTGYRWAVEEIDEDILNLEDSGFALPSDVGIGGGGERTLRFIAKSTGTTHLELELRREWEVDTPASQRYGLMIQVE